MSCVYPKSISLSILVLIIRELAWVNVMFVTSYLIVASRYVESPYLFLRSPFARGSGNFILLPSFSVPLKGADGLYLTCSIALFSSDCRSNWWRLCLCVGILHFGHFHSSLYFRQRGHFFLYSVGLLHVSHLLFRLYLSQLLQ